MSTLNDPWKLGPYTVPNRVGLAPLAGIGNWFVRLQAERHGAGFACSEMVSSHAIHHGNDKTHHELLRIDDRERFPVLQLFGQDPDVMRSAAAFVGEHRPAVKVIDLNMGCPVPKVCKTGAGAALLKDPDTAVQVAKAAREGSGLPVTVKLRSGLRQGDNDGVTLARRLVDEAGVCAITFHPRSAAVHHKGVPDYDLARELVRTLDAPVILTGGLRSRQSVLDAYEHTGAAALLLARGSLGNPWLFEELLSGRRGEPTTDEVVREWRWVIDRAEEHLGPVRAGRYLRKFHPWYVERIGGSKALAARLQQTDRTDAARDVLDGLSNGLIAA